MRAQQQQLTTRAAGTARSARSKRAVQPLEKACGAARELLAVKQPHARLAVLAGHELELVLAVHEARDAAQPRKLARRLRTMHAGASCYDTFRRGVGPALSSQFQSGLLLRASCCVTFGLNVIPMPPGGLIWQRSLLPTASGPLCTQGRVCGDEGHMHVGCASAGPRRCRAARGVGTQRERHAAQRTEVTAASVTKGFHVFHAGRSISCSQTRSAGASISMCVEIGILR